MADQTAQVEYSDSVPGVPLEVVLRTEELLERPTREPDRELERCALDSLALHLETTPQTILTALADTILSVLRSDSAALA